MIIFCEFVSCVYSERTLCIYFTCTNLFIEQRSLTPRFEIKTNNNNNYNNILVNILIKIINITDMLCV